MTDRTGGSRNTKEFVPLAMSSFRGLGPAAREFLTMPITRHGALDVISSELTTARYIPRESWVVCAMAMWVCLAGSVVV